MLSFVVKGVSVWEKGAASVVLGLLLRFLEGTLLCFYLPCWQGQDDRFKSVREGEDGGGQENIINLSSDTKLTVLGMQRASAQDGSSSWKDAAVVNRD